MTTQTGVSQVHSDLEVLQDMRTRHTRDNVVFWLITALIGRLYGAHLETVSRHISRSLIHLSR